MLDKVVPVCVSVVGKLPNDAGNLRVDKFLPMSLDRPNEAKGRRRESVASHYIRVVTLIYAIEPLHM